MTPITVQCTTFPAVTWQPQPDGWPGEALVVYRASMAEFTPFLPVLRALLQPDEQLRAGRYHQSKDQQRFIIARGVLRLLLGQRTGQHPVLVRFGMGVNKKPELPDFPAIHYNVAHAGNWILIAIGDKPVGVDVEQMNDTVDYPTVMAATCSANERAYVTASPDSQRRFYELWTRKEALTKATAKGIDDDFSRIPALPGLHQVAGDLLHTTGNWRVGSFRVTDTYPAALAYPHYSQTLDESIPAFYHADARVVDALSAQIR